MKRALFGVLLALALPAGAQNTNDPRDVKTYGKTDSEIQEEERNFKDGEVVLPPAPKPGNLIEFFPSSASSFRFYVDSTSLSVRGDLVRYTLVARSPSGYENVSYEGIRCRVNLVRLYAFFNNGTWTRSSGDWKTIETGGVQRWHAELRNRYFCPLQLPVMNAAEGLDALRRGGHPLARGTGDPERY